MQYWYSPDQAFFKHSLHTYCISNSAILRNNYISLLSDLCACVHMKKKWHRKGSYSSSVSGSNRLVRLQTWKKAMGWCTAQWKLLLFHAKTIMKESCKFELAHLNKRKRRRNILAVGQLSGSVFLQCLLAPLGVLFVMKTLEDEPQQCFSAHSGISGMSKYIPGALSAADILRPVVYYVTVNNEGDATNGRWWPG